MRSPKALSSPRSTPSHRAPSFVHVPGSSLGGGRDPVIESIIAATAEGRSVYSADALEVEEGDDPRQQVLQQK